ncbi:MAG: MMPL family transporter [Gammaproteobacteria bacterium]
MTELQTQAAWALAVLDRFVRWPLLTVLVGLIAVAAVSFGSTRLTITTDLRVYFSAANPQLASLEAIESKYRENDSLVFVVIPATGNVFEAPTLKLLHDLTEAAWQLPFARRVSSLSNYQHTRSEGDTLFTDHLVTEPDNLTDERIAAIRQIAATEPGLDIFLVAPDASLATVSVLFSIPKDDNQSLEKIVAEGRRLANSFSANADVDIMLAGSTTNSVTLGEAVASDIASLISFSFGLMVILLLILLRSLLATGLVMVIIGCSVAATMGVFGWAGTVLSPTAAFVPSVVMTIAVADCVHVLVSYFVELDAGRAKPAAIREALRINLSPVFITSLTTAVGVLSLNLSDSPPYRDLGNMVAVGVVVAFLLSLTVLPAALAVLPVPKRGAAVSGRFPADGLTGFVTRHHRLLLVAGMLFIAAMAAQIPRNQLNERWHEYFSEQFEIRRAVDLLNDHMGGIHRLFYDLETRGVDGVMDPAYLDTLDGFADWFEQQPGVAATTGLHTTVKRLHQALNYDNPEFFAVPTQRQAIAQYLLLYEFSLPVGETLDNLIDQDRSASRFSVVVAKTDSEQLLELDRAATQWLEKNAPMIVPVAGTGLDLIFAHITHRNIYSLLLGTGLALMVISVILALVLRSIRLGLVSLLPNLAPAIIAYGLWGSFVGHIDLALSVVICMSLGIVVDDTVHFLSKYLRARRERGLDAVEGIRYAFRTVGMALTVTSIVLVCGFALLLLSDFGPTGNTGALMALTLAIALAVDFLLLPPLLLVTEKLAPKLGVRATHRQRVDL